MKEQCRLEDIEKAAVAAASSARKRVEDARVRLKASVRPVDGNPIVLIEGTPSQESEEEQMVKPVVRRTKRRKKANSGIDGAQGQAYSKSLVNKEGDN